MSVSLPLIKIEIKYEYDVVLARQRARQLAALVGFESQDQVRIATAVSELARNAFQYTGNGKVEFSINGTHPQALQIVVRDQGRGISNLKEILGGGYISKTGMGVGLIGAKRLMDKFEIDSSDEGTTVLLCKDLPKSALIISKKDVGKITEKLASNSAADPFQEIQRQNQELLAAMDEVQRQKSAVNALNLELEETNRGVVALYAELDQRADYLKRASEMKTQFLSNMTHEFRTPLNSILSISNMLLQRLDGELTEEQEKQVSFIHAGARSLSDLVNDLLDLAKVEAGKVTVRPSTFEVTEMFRMLRGMLRPLVESNKSVELIFDEASQLPSLFADEGKVSQILRNFISNGLKYTRSGEVRVSARQLDDNTVAFEVEDTGVGIPQEEHERIFEEFTQIEGDHQTKIKGTGLGLPLSRKLAHILGGGVRLDSAPGKGSVFSLIMPIRYVGPDEASYDDASEPAKIYKRILIIDDNPADRYVTKKLLAAHAETLIEANNGTEGLALAESVKPSIIILDLNMPDITGEEVLKQLKEQITTQDIPVIVHTSQLLSAQERKALLKRASAISMKGGNDSNTLAKELTTLINIPAKRNRKALHA